jgi:pSer/pThr/pTyr-binding forkhead associated (FHA) protein
VSKLTLSFKGKSLKIYPVPQGSLTIGSDPSCDIVIDSLAVAAQHARVDTHGNASNLVAVDEKEGTFIHQQQIREHKLQDGDLIRIGKHNLTFTYEEVNNLAADESTTSLDIHGMDEAFQQATESTAAAAHTHKAGWLQILSGQNLGKTLSLTQAITNLGKPGLATAVITRRNEGYFISQLEGKAPLLVGTETLGDRTLKLNDGDVIQFGNIRMQFYLA